MAGGKGGSDDDEGGGNYAKARTLSSGYKNGKAGGRADSMARGAPAGPLGWLRSTWAGLR